MMDTTDVVGGIIDAANRTLRALDQIERCVFTIRDNHAPTGTAKLCNEVLENVADARKEQLEIKALF